MLMSARTINHVKENLAGCTTWPEQFSKAGYTTFITGKWHNSPQALTRVFPQGKAVFIGGMGNPYKLPVADISPEHRLSNQRTSGVHSVQLFADCAIEFLKRQKSDQPFLCYVAFNCPHDPRIAPDSYREPYLSNKPPLPANFLPLHPFNNGEMSIRDEQLAPWPRTPELVQQHLADYYSYITYMDDQIGRILNALKETGHHENTLIVFSSDNGLSIGSHGLFGKQNLYDESTHLPLILAGPGIPKGKVTDAFTYLIDIFPTLGAYCGVSAPEGSEGQNLKPLLQGEISKVRDSIFTSYKKIQRAVRDDRWHLIVYTRINKTQLFDLVNDPHETRDLAGDPSYAGELRRMTALLEDWQKKLDDNVPLTTDKPDRLEFDFSKVKRTQPKGN
jgi:arylsulfatase A-like enzyme